jgi:hypothetical protein
MTPLAQALRQTSWRFLRLVGRLRGLHFPSNIPKAELVGRLLVRLTDPAEVRLTWQSLPEPARQALADLGLAGGRLAQRHLQLTYGALRDAPELVRLYQQTGPPLPEAGGPFSPLEQLCLLGFMFQDRRTEQLFIPAEVMGLLAALVDQAPPGRPAADPKTLGVDLLQH